MTRQQLNDQFGLFVWKQDGRYHIDDALGLYSSEQRADRTATAMNQRGEYEGMVVVRQHFSRVSHVEKTAPPSRSSGPEHHLDQPVAAVPERVRHHSEMTIHVDREPFASLPPMSDRLAAEVIRRASNRLSRPAAGMLAHRVAADLDVAEVHESQDQGQHVEAGSGSITGFSARHAVRRTKRSL